MADEVLKRIDARLKEVGKSRRGASIEAGLGPDYIRDLERGATVSPTLRALEKLAPILGTTVPWLADGTGPDGIVEAQPGTVPLIGYVGAGAEAVLFGEGQGQYDEVPAPEGATDDTVAVEIRGESLGELFDRWLVFYDDVKRPLSSDMMGKLCVVGLADGRILVKKVARGTRRPVQPALEYRAADL